MKLRDLGESGFIRRISKSARTDGSVVRGIGDDAAVIERPRGRYLLFASDMITEGVHFKKSDPPYAIGAKALGVNISDVAAMGGEPKYATVSIGLPGGLDAAFADAIYAGIRNMAKRFKVNIVGGDTVSSGKIVIDIAIIGEAGKKGLTLRSGAEPGDIIAVTGLLGGSIKGRHLNFTPRVREALFLTRNFGINAMIDISDGLSDDLAKLCEASRAGARVYESLIPFSKNRSSLKGALNDGEDFELLFTAPAKNYNSLLRSFKRRFRTPLTAIGEIRSKRDGIKIINRSGKAAALKLSGFKHF